MKNYIDPLVEKSEMTLDYITNKIDRSLTIIAKIPESALTFFNNTSENTTDKIYYRLNKNTNIGKALRYGSLPYSVIIPKAYKYLFFNEGRELIFSPGVHMVRAKVGGGKSLLSFILAEISLDQTGLGSYFTSPVEKPQLTEDGKLLYVYHRYINLDDYYNSNGEKIKRFNTEKHKIIMKDERHLEFNPRLNNTTEYKDKFIPQQKDEILMRHQGITHIYKFSQYTKLDGQDMQALTYMHDVETVKDIPVKRWLNTGGFQYIPTLLKITTYMIEVAFDGGMKRKKVGSCKISVPYELLERFDTHAEKYQTAGLPVDYK